MTKPRQFTLKDGAPPVRLEPSREIRPYYVRGPRGHARPEVFGPGGVVFRDGGDEQEQAAREWLWHLEAGHFSGEPRAEDE